MTCGECVYCVQNNVCDGDCKCNARSTDGITFDVSQEDDTRTYGSSDGANCEFFVPRAVLGQIEQTILMDSTTREFRTISVSFFFWFAMDMPWQGGVAMTTSTRERCSLAFQSSS